MEHYVTLGKVDEFRAGNMRPFKVDGTEIAVARVGEHFYAFSNICTHRFEYMTEGFIEGRNVLCAVHEAEYDMATGAVVSGPAFDPLPVYPVRVVDDEVQLGWARPLEPQAIIPDYHDDQDDFSRQFII